MNVKIVWSKNKNFIGLFRGSGNSVSCQNNIIQKNGSLSKQMRQKKNGETSTFIDLGKLYDIITVFKQFQWRTVKGSGPVISLAV